MWPSTATGGRDRYCAIEACDRVMPMVCRKPCIGVFADAVGAPKADHWRLVTPSAGDFAMKLHDHPAATPNHPTPRSAAEDGSFEGL